ncbi:MAG: hypothetical protein J5804_05395 [Eggerthellaceae bacterium]|nr:hypothetical protein [Eggerthellaceae bacterium]
MTQQSPVRIDIIGGYLGAGKTTFLNKLVHDGLAAERVAIIENEFGKEPIDDAVIDNPGFTMSTLASGCICCTLKVDFMTCIADIVDECEPDRILIEPTGLAAPEELEKTCKLLSNSKRISANVSVNSMTAIVDATDATEMVEYEIPVYMKQIEQAHLIVLSHTQELDAEHLAEAKHAVQAHARPGVIIIDAPWNEIDALEILSLSEQAYASNLAQRDDTDVHRAEGIDTSHIHDAHNHEHHERHDHHHYHEGFSSVLLKPGIPFDDKTIEQLNEALDAQDTSRAKGFLPAPDGALLHYEYVNGRARISASSYSGPAKLIVIGMHVDVSAFSFVEGR